jgi:hypothetical protein
MGQLSRGTSLYDSPTVTRLCLHAVRFRVEYPLWSKAGLSQISAQELHGLVNQARRVLAERKLKHQGKYKYVLASRLSDGVHYTKEIKPCEITLSARSPRSDTGFTARSSRAATVTRSGGWPAIWARLLHRDGRVHPYAIVVAYKCVVSVQRLCQKARVYRLALVRVVQEGLALYSETPSRLSSYCVGPPLLA